MAEHAQHDLMSVAAAADRAGRLPGSLVACADCVRLVGDLRVLALAVPMAVIPTRPRDLRLTTEDAARLRPRGRRAVLAAFVAGLDAARRPLALGLTSLGLVGLLLGSLPVGLPMADGAAAGPTGVETTIDQPPRTLEGQGVPGVAGSAGPGDVASPPRDLARPSVVSAPEPAAALDRSALRALSFTFLVLGLGILAGGWLFVSRRAVR